MMIISPALKEKLSVRPRFLIAAVAVVGGLYVPLIGWNDAEAENRQSSESAQEGEESYKVKAVLLDRERKDEDEAIVAEDYMTGAGMIGRSVLDSEGRRIAALEDIIIDENGRAGLVVFTEGGFFGLGAKLAALDYQFAAGPETGAKNNTGGDVLKPLDEDAIDRVVGFSYKPIRRDRGTRIMPENSYRLSALLQANVLDPQGETVAEIDNAILRSGQVAYLILGVDKALGMGGKQIAISYKALTIAEKGGDFEVRLTSEQTEELESLKTELGSR